MSPTGCWGEFEDGRGALQDAVIDPQGVIPSFTGGSALRENRGSGEDNLPADSIKRGPICHSFPGNTHLAKDPGFVRGRQRLVSKKRLKPTYLCVFLSKGGCVHGRPTWFPNLSSSPQVISADYTAVSSFSLPLCQGITQAPSHRHLTDMVTMAQIWKSSYPGVTSANKLLQCNRGNTETKKTDSLGSCRRIGWSTNWAPKSTTGHVACLV